MGTKSKSIKRIEEAKIIFNREIAEDHFLLELEAPYLAKVSAPGQFVNVKISDNTTDPLLRIPLGIHSANNKKINLLYKVVGKGTFALSKRTAGEKLSVLGPLGNGFDIAALSGTKKREAVLVAGGHGVAPLFYLAEFLSKGKIKTIFLIGARTGKHVVRVDKIKKVADKVMISTEDGTAGYKGFVTDLLEEYLKKTKGEKPAIFACGPKPMLAAISKVTEKEGVEAQVSLDEYMACGIGACLGCAVKTKTGYKLVCKDGPVFNSGEIDWQTVVSIREDRCKNEA